MMADHDVGAALLLAQCIVVCWAAAASVALCLAFL
jgi:hypothetical protein